MSPADAARPPGSPAFTAAPRTRTNKEQHQEQGAAAGGKTVRARRLMKEFRDLQRWVAGKLPGFGWFFRK